MFRRLNLADSRNQITLEIDGNIVQCFEGDTVSSVVMLDAAQPYRRSILSASERAPLCMMGTCFECLVEINDVPNQQGCLRNVEQDMRIRRQLSIRTVTA